MSRKEFLEIIACAGFGYWALTVSVTQWLEGDYQAMFFAVLGVMLGAIGAILTIIHSSFAEKLKGKWKEYKDGSEKE